MTTIRKESDDTNIIIKQAAKDAKLKLIQKHDGSSNITLNKSSQENMFDEEISSSDISKESNIVTSEKPNITNKPGSKCRVGRPRKNACFKSKVARNITCGQHSKQKNDFSIMEPLKKKAQRKRKIRIFIMMLVH